MKIAIAMATYKRADINMPFFLQRALDSIFTQKHQDFKVFVVGDDYEEPEELFNIISKYPKEKISCINLKKSIERTKYKDHPGFLWDCGGVTASNCASNLALREGLSYISHLDHDDYWSPEHLFLIDAAIELMGASFICTRALFEGGSLPEINLIQPFVMPFYPIPHGIINSSTCYDYKKIPFKYKANPGFPADADLWVRIREYMIEHNIKGVFINKATCYYHKR